MTQFLAKIFIYKYQRSLIPYFKQNLISLKDENMQNNEEEQDTSLNILKKNESQENKSQQILGHQSQEKFQNWNKLTKLQRKKLRQYLLLTVKQKNNDKINERIIKNLDLTIIKQKSELASKLKDNLFTNLKLSNSSLRQEQSSYIDSVSTFNNLQTMRKNSLNKNQSFRNIQDPADFHIQIHDQKQEIEEQKNAYLSIDHSSLESNIYGISNNDQFRSIEDIIEKSKSGKTTAIYQSQDQLFYGRNQDNDGRAFQVQNNYGVIIQNQNLYNLQDQDFEHKKQSFMNSPIQSIKHSYPTYQQYSDDEMNTIDKIIKEEQFIKQSNYNPKNH
eukprot:403366119